VRIPVPDLSLVVLVGPSGCGKSTFARAHFGRFETVSSDFCRALVASDENDQSATGAAFEDLHAIVARRLDRGLLTVVDATNVHSEARRPLLALARRFHVPSVAVVFDLPEELCVRRNVARAERTVDAEVVARQRAQMLASLGALRAEGFRAIFMLRAEEAVAAAAVERQPSPVDRRGDRGPFDIVGDVHGCADELEELLAALGYLRDEGGTYRHPAGRRVIFLGDLVDRGPRVPDVLRIAMAMVDAGTALALPGNHDDKLARKLRGRDVQVKHGLEQSLAQLEGEPPAFRDRVRAFIEGLPSHYVLDGGELVVAHAGMKAALQGRDSNRVRDFALYGETTGELDEMGLPVRQDWAASYRGRAHVVYGHTPVFTPEWINGTIDVDTGCVFGNRLTALRWPERELISVAARRTYAESRRPISAPAAEESESI
jgi:protein phosphatase